MSRILPRTQASRLRWAFALILGLWLVGLTWLSVGGSSARARQDEPPSADAGQDGGKADSEPAAQPDSPHHRLSLRPLLWPLAVSGFGRSGRHHRAAGGSDLRLGIAIPPKFVENFTNTVNQRHFREAFQAGKAEPSFLGKVLTAGMGKAAIRHTRMRWRSLTTPSKASKPAKRI